MSEIENSSRLEEFKQEIESIDVTGGRANPERRLLVLGIIFGIGGIILVLAAFLVSRSSNMDGKLDMIIMGLLGLSLVLAGTILYITNKLTRFFRYWLIRLIYEHRAQIDRLEK